MTVNSSIVLLLVLLQGGAEMKIHCSHWL